MQIFILNLHDAPKVVRQTG